MRSFAEQSHIVLRKHELTANSTDAWEYTFRIENLSIRMEVSVLSPSLVTEPWRQEERRVSAGECEGTHRSSSAISQFIEHIQTCIST